MRYDREKLEVECLAWFRQSKTGSVRLDELVRFARVRSQVVFRGRADADDLNGYFLEKLWDYWNRPTFDPSPWISNPVACLNQFFQSRARDYLRTLPGSLPPFDDGRSVKTPDEVFQTAETRDQVRAVVSVLPERSQRIYLIRYGEDLRPREAAQALGWDVAEVYRATAELKRRVRVLWSESSPSERRPQVA